MAAIERITDQKTKEHLLLDLIHRLSVRLKISEYSKDVRMDAADALKALYKRYGKNEHYPPQDKYWGGDSEHTDTEDCYSGNCYPHTDYYTDTLYSFYVDFNTKED